MSRPWRKHPSQQFFHPILSELHISSGAKTAVKYEIDQVLKVGGDYRYSGTVRAYYRRWRKMHSLPDRCDNKDCMFHTQPLLWSNEKLPLILDRKSGNRDDNRAENLRFLCPNCDSQNTETKAGANVGKIRRLDDGTYFRKRADGTEDAVLKIPSEQPAETFGIAGIGHKP